VASGELVFPKLVPEMKDAGKEDAYPERQRHAAHGIEEKRQEQSEHEVRDEVVRLVIEADSEQQQSYDAAACQEEEQGERLGLALSRSEFVHLVNGNGRFVGDA
jgi:hypothetical protein